MIRSTEGGVRKEIWQRPCRSERCALLILHMRRTNRHTGLALRSRLLVADLAGHASDAAEAMAALYGKASTAASGEVLPALLRDGHALVALVVCLPPTAKDRDEVLAVLEVGTVTGWISKLSEALGLRQSWAQTAETRPLAANSKGSADLVGLNRVLSRFSPPIEPCRHGASLETSNFHQFHTISSHWQCLRPLSSSTAATAGHAKAAALAAPGRFPLRKVPVPSLESCLGLRSW